MAIDSAVSLYKLNLLLLYKSIRSYFVVSVAAVIKWSCFLKERKTDFTNKKTIPNNLRFCVLPLFAYTIIFVCCLGMHACSHFQDRPFNF